LTAEGNAAAVAVGVVGHVAGDGAVLHRDGRAHRVDTATGAVGAAAGDGHVVEDGLSAGMHVEHAVLLQRVDDHRIRAGIVGVLLDRDGRTSPACVQVLQDVVIAGGVVVLARPGNGHEVGAGRQVDRVVLIIGIGRRDRFPQRQVRVAWIHHVAEGSHVPRCQQLPRFQRFHVHGATDRTAEGSPPTLASPVGRTTSSGNFTIRQAIQETREEHR